MPKKAHFPGVNPVRRRDGGGLYYYHRASGIRLPDDYGSPAFAKAWAEAEARSHAPRITERDPGSYLAMVEAFKDSDDWKSLADQTRKDYQKIFDWMGAQGSDAKPAAALTQARCEKLLDLAVKELGWRRGLYVLQVNRRLYNWVLERSARKRHWGEVNPWLNLPAPQRPRNAPRKNRPWKPEELAEVLLNAPLGLRRAYVLGASGMDGGTIIKRRWDEYRNGGFELERGKTGAQAFVMVPRLLRLFLEEDERPSEFIATNVLGERFVEANTLQTRSSEFLRGLASAGSVGAGLTLHGLRHTIGKAVAESGGTLHAIQGALQHKSPRMALYYSEQADKRRALVGVGDALDSWLGSQSTEDRDSKAGSGKSKKPNLDK